MRQRPGRWRSSGISKSWWTSPSCSWELTPSGHASPEVFELYRLALQESKTCGVVRAKSSADSLLGTVVICSPGSAVSSFLPALQPGSSGGLVGGIVAPVVPVTAQATTVLQGLALMGVRQNKAHKSARSVLTWVSDESYEPLLAMQFEVLQSFEELTNVPENVSTAAGLASGLSLRGAPLVANVGCTQWSDLN